ncbi:MAG: terpene cyclase/mutase family protein [Planctomycetota bacterium]|nr:terpene cyclase/mutase family protein [Planctomycetota bacterium]MDA1261505.1 terpene cyclase/mutase family protein [Planctomycetota bacterium]
MTFLAYLLSVGFTSICLTAPDDGAAKQSPFTEPTVPLDARVAKTKVTEQTLPALPSAIAQPLPAIHRISLDAKEVPCSAKSWADARRAIELGLARLRSTQDVSGGWMVAKPVVGTDQKKPSSAAATAVTALGLKAFAQTDRIPTNDSTAKKARDFVRERLGGIGNQFDPDAEGGLGNYVACAVTSGLAAVDDPSDRPLIETSVQWLTRQQWDQSEGVSPRMDWFGGSGYGKWGRPDLSNTQLMLDALHDAQVSPEDPAVQRALVFLTRTQNLAQSNSAEWAQVGANDGGFIYTPANGGESFSSEAEGQGRYGEKIPQGQPRSLKSYGSMTYSGFKSLLYAGLSSDDPRVRAAYDWIRKHWTFAENPGVGQQGYFYYVHALSRALLAARQDVVTDATGVDHQWRDELIAALIAKQKPDGSWVNESSRWEESNADLCTIYCLLALEEAIKPARPSTPAAQTKSRQ